MIEFPPFVTGSRAYGTPKGDSDFDLVVLVSEEVANALHDFVFDAKESCVNQYGDSSVSLKLDGLNLILCTKESQWRCWDEGTRKLIEQKPVTRDQAVKTFKALRAEYKKAEGK